MCTYPWSYSMSRSKSDRRVLWEQQEQDRLALKKSRCDLVYSERQRVLELLGYNSYRDYLLSPLWKSIRDKVLRGKCVICDKTDASQVHHRNYLYETLAGQCLDQLIPLCGKCHRKIEFSHRNKRTPQDTDNYCRILLLRASKRKLKKRSKKRVY